MKILVTGCAGFIGFHVAKRLLERGDDVVGIDNLSDYYDVSLKQARLEHLLPHKNFTFVKADISDRKAMEELFSGSHCEGRARSNPSDAPFARVIHLAAQAGVRYSLENPHAYVDSNLVGFLNILEGCRHLWSGLGTRDSELGTALSESRIPNPQSRHLVFASSSSVYGLNTKLPFSTGDNVDHPISLYAATKKANELMAHTYSHLYGIPCTGLRFFTVYGPWGRPDMALFKFTRAIMSGEPIDVYNEGRMRRDFTYIDDIVEGVLRVSDRIPEPGTGNREPGKAVPGPRSQVPAPNSSPAAPYKIYNIGNHSPVELTAFIRILEETLGRKARLNMQPMQPGDVAATYADVDDLMRDVGFSPSTPIEDGIRKFIEWWRQYYGKVGEPR